MKKFVIKSSVFVSPFIIIFLICTFFYFSIPGDLIRVGYIISKPGYRDVFSNEKVSKKMLEFPELSKTKKRKFDVLTIGDSFSNQEEQGYNNYLTFKNNLNVLNLDYKLNPGTNPIQTVIDLINGDVLDSIQIDFIVLENVEREFVYRRNVEMKRSVSINTIINKKIKKNVEISDNSFFSTTGLKLMHSNISYLYNNNPKYSKTYKVKATRELFTNKPAELLFSLADVLALRENNISENIMDLNTKLNYINSKLNEKNIKLIVLVCPDKLDLYYDYISNNEVFTKPLFFDVFSVLDKDYLWVNSKELLSQKISSIKDLYFYDDTHWSPNAAKLVADELSRVIIKERRSLLRNNKSL